MGNIRFLIQLLYRKTEGYVKNHCMYRIEKTFYFESGHVLVNHDGKCATPHGHSYILTVFIRSQGLVPDGPKKNMVIDFQDINAIVKPMIVEHLDHKWLNTSLNNDSPTAEFIAKWIFDYLKPKLPGLYAVSLNETATAKVYYEP